MRILWLGFAVPEERNEILAKIDARPAIQTQNFGWGMIRALRDGFGSVFLGVSWPVQNYPKAKKIWFSGEEFISQGVRGRALWFVNILGLKQVTRLFSCVAVLGPRLMRKEFDWMFIHGVHSPYLLFGVLARLMGCKVAMVLTDPPGVILSDDGVVVRGLKKLDALVVKTLLGCGDVVLALSPYLVTALAPGKRALVFPGVVNSQFEKLCAREAGKERASASASLPIVLAYAGSLERRYGVAILVEAVCRLNQATPGAVILKLFGRGDFEQELATLANRHAGIKYEGFCDKDLLVAELFGADVLVNPRPSKAEFAVQSFPSKLLEYLMTGRPVLTTRIASIPKEMEGCFYYIDDESAQGISDALQALVRKSPDERRQFGERARDFVRKNYSEKTIGTKIKRMLQDE